jgi:CBS domain-containing protein
VILASHRISGVPVVDEGGTLVGVVSETDIVGKEAGEDKRSARSRFFSRRGRTGAGAPTAEEAMSSPAITIGPHRDVSEAARLMVERAVNRLPSLRTAGSSGSSLAPISFAHSCDQTRTSRANCATT